ncbi:MAG TPA: adenosylcobinamide-GDP ribazoletransferase [Stellaceae bacterium]|nr:adenosylcobinamide-GDP ribazoletransferase [Stellaceae bacterium]
MDDGNNSDFSGRVMEARLAIAFLTRLPLAGDSKPEPGALARAAWAFPLAGVLVGAVGAIVLTAGDRLGLPILASALLVVTATIVVTGALHEDGLADFADGLGGGDATRSLAIMRDSRIGTFGVLALVLDIGLRAAALAALPDTRFAAGALISAHALSRGLLPAIMVSLDPARSDGLGVEAGRPSPAVAGIAGAIGLVVALVALHAGRGLVAVLLAALAMAALALLARRRLGGYTGDVLGAAQQVGEIVMLLVATL